MILMPTARPGPKSDGFSIVGNGSGACGSITTERPREYAAPRSWADEKGRIMKSIQIELPEKLAHELDMLIQQG